MQDIGQKLGNGNTWNDAKKSGIYKLFFGFFFYYHHVGGKLKFYGRYIGRKRARPLKDALILTARAGKEKGGERSPLFLYVQKQVVSNGLFDFPLLYADITLCDGGRAVLQKVLDEDNVVIVRPVYLRCVPLAERMGADAVIAEIVTDFAQMLLYLRRGERDNHSVRCNLMVNAIDTQELIERKRNSEGSGFSGLLFRDGQAVAFPVLYNIG